MKRILSVTITLIMLIATSCQGGGDQKPNKATMQNSADSMSYALGINIGANLIGRDSLLNIDMVCEGIVDAYRGEALLSDEEVRMAFLKYMNYDNYERVRAYETQFLGDLRRQDRKFVATSSGLTYKVDELGDLSTVVRNNRDTVLMRYRVLNAAGEVVDTTYLHADTARLGVGALSRGVIEAVKLIGKGGHIEAWLPSTLAFGSAGCDSLNVRPNTMLYYEMWLIDVE